MQIQMTETREGSEDGISLQTYDEGQTYDVPEPLVGIFVRAGWAQEVGVESKEPESKGLNGAPENKGTPKKATTAKKADLPKPESKGLNGGD